MNLLHIAILNIMLTKNYDDFFQIFTIYPYFGKYTQYFWSKSVNKLVIKEKKWLHWIGFSVII